MLVLQHHPSEGLGRIAASLERHQLQPQMLPFERECPSSLDATSAGLIVLGGPMGAYDEGQYPRLRAERLLIEDALKRNIPVLGICLGSQLLASVLGANVRPSGGIELGWADIFTTPEAREDRLFASLAQRLRALHWHGDVFDLPHHAASLASSAQTAHQAFAYEQRAWGLLFHLEADQAQVERMALQFPHDLQQAQLSLEALQEQSRHAEAQARQHAALVFDAWSALAAQSQI